MNTRGEASEPLHDYQVGDILCYVWGHEQTNVDFFQVVRVTPHAVVYRPIESKVVPHDDQAMAGTATPLKDQFKGEEATKRVDKNGRVKMQYSRARKWNGAPVYCSWYG